MHSDIPSKTPFDDELDSESRVAVQAVIEQTLAPEAVAAAIANLSSVRDHEHYAEPASINGRKLMHDRNSPRRSLVVSACGLAFALIWFAASTEAWAQVTSEIKAPVNEPKSVLQLDSVSPEVQHGPDSIGSTNLVLRMLLLFHISSLMIGMLLMAITWFDEFWSWLQSRGRDVKRESGGSTERRNWLLRTAIVIYVVGIFTGCIWSAVIWGRIWSWDPREAFALVTTAVCVLWLRSPPMRNSSDATVAASTATIAFGTVLLLQLLGGLYVARISLVERSTFAATCVALGIVAMVALYWLLHFASLRAHRRREV